MESVQNYVNTNVQNLLGSANAFAVGGLFQFSEKSIVVILPDKESANYFKSDIENLIGESKILFLPDSFTKPFYIHQPDAFNIQQRTEVLNGLYKRKNPYILITYPEALTETVIHHAELKKNRVEINIGDKFDIDFIIEFLNEFHFERVDFVYEPGQYSIRGGIIDIFSFSYDFPYRIELNGN